MLSRGANVQTNVVLTCMATGFSSMNTIIRIKRDGRLLTKDDGVQTSGLRPNEDGTFQQRDHVEIPKNDKSNYTCEVVHESSGLHMVKVWGKKLFLFFFINTPKKEARSHVSQEKTWTGHAHGFSPDDIFLNLHSCPNRAASLPSSSVRTINRSVFVGPFRTTSTGAHIK